MKQALNIRRCAGLTLAELLVVIAVIGIVIALLSPALSRSKEKAKRSQCANQLRQFHSLAVMYADDHEGYLCSYEDMLKRIPMICPSDDSNGKRQKGFVYSLPTSFMAFPVCFAQGDARGLHSSAWKSEIMLTEYESFHDLSRQPGFEPGKWKGRFLTLSADGSVEWRLFEQ